MFTSKLFIFCHHHRSAIIALLLVTLPAAYLTWMWFDYREAWLHPELLGTSAYIWNFPDSETFLDRLRKVLDWKAFDPNVNRVRPLNDFAEVIDAIARPYLTQILGPHPSFTPFALLTAIFSPLLLFRCLRSSKLDNIRAAALIAVFLSSIGFLSVIIAYIRPAKKLTILLLCVSLYFAYRHARKGKSLSFLSCTGSLYLSFFADEMALANYLIIGVLFFPSLLYKTSSWKRLVFASLPIFFLIAVKWILPAIYLEFSVHGAWDALADSKKFELFRYLAEPEFYRISLIHTARAFLSTVGVKQHSVINEILALAILIGGGLLPLFNQKLFKQAPNRCYNLIAMTIAFFAVSFYTTLLDWYPFPWEISYLGSFTYYYHSSLVILVVLWLSFFWEILCKVAQNNRRLHQTIIIGGVTFCAVVTVSNFSMFHSVNRLVQIIHTYPYYSESIHHQIYTQISEIKSENKAIKIAFAKESDRLSKSFEDELAKIFSNNWRNNDFYRLFREFKVNPIMKDFHLSGLLNSYFPNNKFIVNIESEQVR